MLPADIEADDNMSPPSKYIKTGQCHWSPWRPSCYVSEHWIKSEPSHTGAVRKWCIWLMVGTCHRVPGNC